MAVTLENLRAVVTIAALVFVAACSAPNYRLSDDATRPFLDTHRYYEWEYSVSEFPQDVIPSIYRLARLRSQPIDAVIRTQHGFHSYTYAVFSNSQVVITGISFRALIAKGHAPYTAPRPRDLIESLEADGKCVAWEHSNADFIPGDLLTYGEGDDMRLCVEPDAFFGGPNRIRTYLWSNYDGRNSTWTYRRHAGDE